jgi:DNA-binding Lrp family transcriptional regulator
MELDRFDKKILELLSIDGRISIKDIARKAGMRPSTVHQRITKLKKQGVIERFTIKLNNKLANQSFIVFMFIKTKNYVDEKIFSHNSVKEVFGVTGNYDLVIKCKFKDIEEFNSFVMELRKNQSIIDTLTMVSTTTIKEEI